MLHGRKLFKMVMVIIPLRHLLHSISLLSSDSSMGELVTGEQVIEWEALFLDKDKEYCW